VPGRAQQAILVDVHVAGTSAPCILAPSIDSKPTAAALSLAHSVSAPVSASVRAAVDRASCAGSRPPSVVRSLRPLPFPAPTPPRNRPQQAAAAPPSPCEARPPSSPLPSSSSLSGGEGGPPPLAGAPVGRLGSGLCAPCPSGSLRPPAPLGCARAAHPGNLN